MLASKPVCVLKTSLAAKSIASLVKRRWQLRDVSGCSWEMASVWAGEQVPAKQKNISINPSTFPSRQLQIKVLRLEASAQR